MDMWSKWIKLQDDEQDLQHSPQDSFFENVNHHKDLASALDYSRRQYIGSLSDSPSLEILCSYITDSLWLEIYQAQARQYQLFCIMAKALTRFARSCARVYFTTVVLSPLPWDDRENSAFLPPEFIRGLEGLRDFLAIAREISERLARMDLDNSPTGNFATAFHADMRRLEQAAAYTEEQMQAAQGTRDMKPADDEGGPEVTPVGEIGPKGLLVWAIRGLLYRNLDWLPLIRDSYSNFVGAQPYGTTEQHAAIFEDMRIQAVKDPKKSLIREMTFFEEHLSRLQKSCATLKRTLGCLDKVLDPNSFEFADRARRAQYQLEKKAIDRVTEKLEGKEKELKEMVEGCGALISKAKIGVEIREEDHGKAIFVFTAVTTVFLPLSFITSYFGMNFADLRDTHWNQAMYWVIAGPATFVIVATTLMVAYNTDELRNSLSSANKHLFQAVTSSYSALGSFGLAMIPNLRRSSASTQEWISSSQELQSFRFSGVFGRLTTRVKAIFSQSGSESVSGSSESRETV
ncbi:hypothetical protein HDK77DRAFT_70015 [Phyllosticta capitalensis]